MIIEIIRDKHKLGEINFPEKPEQVKLSKFIDFEFDLKSLFSNIKAGLSNQEIATLILNKKYHNTRYAEILNIICRFLDIEPEIILGLPVDEYDFIEAKGLNLHNLLANIVMVTFSYVPPVITSETNKFQYKGETWTLPYFMKTFQLHLGKDAELNPTLRTGDVIEIQESLRVLDSASKDANQQGNYQFMKYLSILAILATKENETLPDTLKGIKVRKEERMKFFEDIDMVTGLNADFFLGCTLQI